MSPTSWSAAECRNLGSNQARRGRFSSCRGRRGRTAPLARLPPAPRAPIVLTPSSTITITSASLDDLPRPLCPATGVRRVAPRGAPSCCTNSLGLREHPGRAPALWTRAGVGLACARRPRPRRIGHEPFVLSAPVCARSPLPGIGVPGAVTHAPPCTAAWRCSDWARQSAPSARRSLLARFRGATRRYDRREVRRHPSRPTDYAHHPERAPSPRSRAAARPRRLLGALPRLPFQPQLRGAPGCFAERFP